MCYRSVFQDIWFFEQYPAHCSEFLAVDKCCVNDRSYNICSIEAVQTASCTLWCVERIGVSRWGNLTKSLGDL